MTFRLTPRLSNSGRIALLSLLAMAATARGGINQTRTSSSFGGGQGTGAAASGGVTSTSQTATTATAATSQAAQTTAIAQRAAITMQRSVAVLQALQSAQTAGRNLSFGNSAPINLIGGNQPVVNGIDVHGLLPGVAGTDPSNAISLSAATTTVPIIVGSTGTASVSLAANSGITLPPSATASSQITVSGTGTVGTITVGNVITPLKGGVATMAPPGSTISLLSAGTVTFSGGAGAIPSNLSTYTYTTTPATATTAAITSNVPGSWTGIGGMTQSTYSSSGSTDSTTVTLTQTQQQALLTWQKFDIGQNTTLDFDQSHGASDVGDWVAINKVASGIAPTQVLGAIQAPGQVYVINQNGVIFGASSQVNTHALVVSSLPINDNLVSRGLLNNPDLQFLFSQVNLAAGTIGPTPAFTPAAAPTTGQVVTTDANGNPQVAAASGSDGDVVVEAGAQISSPTDSTHVGGKVALVGPNVSNAGTISTPDGQTILAAGQEVGFESHPSVSTNPANPSYSSPGPSLRGLDTYVGSVGNAGMVTNSGMIDSDRADITLVGKTINQLGVINSSTSISLNGRIDLLADYGTVAIFPTGATATPNLYPTLTGAVNLGVNSLTEILPELSSTDTIVGSTLALQSLVNIQGNLIDVAGGATLWAPDAAVTVNAGTWLRSFPGYIFLNNTGQITLEQGADIDVSGSEDVSASVAENIISAQLRGTELANSPVQQDGPLRGKTVEVESHDLVSYGGQTYVGTALADLSGYVNLIQHDVGELTVNGGSVTLSAGTAVNLESGSQINVSGGWIDYEGANVQTTQLLTSTGQIVDISQADPTVIYSGIYSGVDVSSAKYNTSQTFSNPTETGAHYESGYVQGGNGGSISVNAPSITVAGNLYGNTVAGSLQRSATSTTTNAGVETWMTVPVSGSLALNFQGINSSLVAVDAAPPDVVFQPGTGPKVADPFAGSGNAEVDLSSDLVNVDGFGNLSIGNSNAHYISGNAGAVTGAGNVAVPAGVSLIAAPGGSINFNAANIDIEGTVVTPGGNLSFTAEDASPLSLSNVSSVPALDSTRGHFSLGAQAVLDASGLLVDDRISSSTAGMLPLIVKGGGIAIAGINVDLVQGSEINVSGGASISTNTSVTYGGGGSISIQGGQDPISTAIQGGSLVLGAELDGYSGAHGGSLSILAPLIQIGGDTLANGDAVSTGRTLWLDPTDGQGNVQGSNFFSQGGFDSFALTGIGVSVTNQTNPLPGLWISSDAKIDPQVESLQISPATRGLSFTKMILPAGQQAPISLSFAAVGVTIQVPTPQLITRGDLVMDVGASIELNPNASDSVSFSGSTVTLLGQVMAPGGAINVTSGKSTTAIFQVSNDVLATVDLGPDSILSTAGATALTPNALGFHTGSVLNGGSITIAGNIVTESGSILDVSGATDVLDLNSNFAPITSSRGSTQTVMLPTTIDSNGGTITLAGAEELYAGGMLRGYAGGITAQGGTSSASGGSLVISSGTLAAVGGQSTNSSLDQIVNGSGLIDVTSGVISYSQTGRAVIGSHSPASAPLPDTTAIIGYGHFAASSFDQSGLDSLTLKGSVIFSGTQASPVTLDANGSLNVATGGIILADDQGTLRGLPINLSASYVDLGTVFLGPLTANQIGAAFQTGQGTPLYLSPTWGLSSLNVTAGELVDIGNLSLQKIGALNVTSGTASTAGGIRGDGTLDVAGQIVLTSAQVYLTTEANFDIVAYNYTDANGAELGSVTINSTGATAEVPLAAGGELNIYGSAINQNGVLRAPIGDIDLGWDGSGASPLDYISGAGSGVTATPATVNVTQTVSLGSSSLTSVSAVDPILGALTIPYGNVANGTAWIDPAGTDITTGGVPAKNISISAVNVVDQAHSTLDISGGGDLYAYDWVTGTNGTNDILNSTSSFAIIPSYNLPYAPFYGTNSASDFVNSKLAVGEQIYLNASNGLPAGTYTLLPAGYALLPGAYLVTPRSGQALTVSSVATTGASLVSGYLFKGLDSTATTSPVLTSFEVAPESVVRSRAEYDNFSANTWLKQSATTAGAPVPRLPIDAGQVVFQATGTMAINGGLNATAGAEGLGGLADIASPEEIDLTSGAVAPTVGVLSLDSATLQNFASASLLIGGFRTTTADGENVTVTTNDIQVDAGATLTGTDVILVSNGTLSVASGAMIELSSPDAGTAPDLVLGNAATPGSGDGVLLRASDDPSASVTRLGVASQATQDALTAPPTLTIGTNVQLGGYAGAGGAITSAGGVTLDSTSRTALDPTINLSGTSTALSSGQISLQLDNPGPLVTEPGGGTTTGLVLSNDALQKLQATTQALSLSSYSSIDIYGDGAIGAAAQADQFPVASLGLHAAEIRGFHSDGLGGLINGGGNITINAGTISLDDSTNGVSPGAASPTAASGSLTFNVGTLVLGTNQLGIDQYANVAVNASQEISFTGTGGVTTSGNLALTTPMITGATAARQTVASAGTLVVTSPTGASSPVAATGLGASLQLVSASITESSAIELPSGSLSLEATSGDVTVTSTGLLDVGGIPKNFNNLTQYTNGGQITLTSDTGSVNLDAGSTVSVAASPVAGNAGTLTIAASNTSVGNIHLDGTLKGLGGAGGQNGSFSLDVGSLPQLSVIDPILNSSGFTHARSIRVRTGDVAVDDTATAQTFNLSTDQGSIAVTGSGLIDASGATGGTISLEAVGSVTLQSGSELTVEGQNFDNAGKGGSVTIEAGDYTVGTANLWQTSTGSGGTEIYTGTSAISLAAGSTINLSIDSVATTTGEATGTVHLRAPQVAGANGIAITSLDGTIQNPSNIVIEGFSVQDAKTTGSAAIDGSLETGAENNASDFMNGAVNIENRLLTSNGSLASVVNVQPGEEIDNSQGDLVLNSDWDLSTMRYGAQMPLAIAESGSYADTIYSNGGEQLSAGVEPGILTIRAAGNVIFNGSLTDGFGDGAGDPARDPITNNIVPWESTLLPTFANGTGMQSWSYRLVAGADLSAANFQQVLPLSSLASGSGSIEIGKMTPSGQAIVTPGEDFTTLNAIIDPNTGISYYQVIRTGTGDITVSAGRDVDLLNQFATIYTAGTQAASLANFDTPILYADDNANVMLYPAQYSQDGGSVSLSAQGNIQHLTQDLSGNIIADSERELPTNWLYRRGDVKSAGNFDTTIYGDVASTTWWVDFSSFFEGVGALGGGNVMLVAGNNISNVDAVVPTNARMTDQTTIDGTVSTLAADQPLTELGGGNLLVQAGNNIDAGVYYVEHGQGALDAGNQILTNATRAPSASTLGVSGFLTQSSYTWLPTTLFLGGQQTDGEGSEFTVSATGDVLLGPTANPFLLPAGIGNSYWDKTYFSTYFDGNSVDAPNSVNVSSLTGSVTLRDASTLTAGTSSLLPILYSWYQNVLLVPPSTSSTAGFYQPWLDLNETSLAQFTTVTDVAAPTLNVNSFSGDIDLVGTINLSPAASGTVNLLAAGSINAFQPVGTTINSLNNNLETVWAAAEVNLSDADPTSIPGVNAPFAYQSQSNVGPNSFRLNTSTLLNLANINSVFAVSGSTTGVHGVLQTQEALHDAGLLHAKDPNPIYLDAEAGDISGLDLYSGKSAQIAAGEDITDIAFYLQNNNADNTSLVESGRDIIAYDSQSALRQEVNLSSSIFLGYGTTAPLGSSFGAPNAGDIQIAGPGTLEVLAGRNLNLGVGASKSDGTGVGITSIGKSANPFLPFGGADIVAAAGIGAPGIDDSQANFGNVKYDPMTASVVDDDSTHSFDKSFNALFLQPGSAASAIYLPQLGALMGLPAGDTSDQIWTAYSQLPTARQDELSLSLFYLALRDSGRSHNNGTGLFPGSYNEGYMAISALFPSQTMGGTWQPTGDISLTSREIKTTNGGNISLLAPGGAVKVGLNIIASNAADQGILTTDGGGIDIFTDGNVNVGTSRIFTLHGGDEVIWSSNGNIAAGNSSKTVQSAPPTRVLVNPQSADVETDLAGLATGGGIGVLQTLAGVPPADVDLIAPKGIVDAGDAGIRASGNLSIAAAQILNAGNISVGGKSSGVPTTSAPNVAGLSSASGSSAAASNSSSAAARQAANRAATQQQDLSSVSIITVEVIGYGGGDID